MQFLKMAWMLTWRITVLNAIFGLSLILWQILLISLIGAGLLRFGLKISIHSFPIIRLLTKRPVVARHDKQKKQDSKAVPTTQPSRTIVDKASQKGRNTGYEPYHLDKLPMPKSPHMRGVPGIGLSSAQHMTDYSIKSGQMGEANFAKALAVTSSTGSRDYSSFAKGMLDRVNSFWSIAMPAEKVPYKADSVFKTDIDCIIVSGKDILLIDTKFYTSGDVTYTSSGNQLHCTDNSTGAMVKGPTTMTRNMEMALQRFKSHYPSMNVSAYVVMMPTNSGAANISNVYWPGRIPAVTIEQILSVIGNLSAVSGTKVSDYSTIHNLSSLQKN